MKILPVGDELLRVEKRWTDRYDETNGRFTQFYECAKKNEQFKNINQVILKSNVGKPCTLIFVHSVVPATKFVEIFAFTMK